MLPLGDRIKFSHGGSRKGAGCKKKFGEPTSTISFRVPISKEKEVKEEINKLLNSYLEN